MLKIIKKIYTVLVLIKNVIFRKKHYTLRFVAERDSVGKIPMVPVSDFKNDRRRNYRAADNKNYLDGDWQSLKSMDDWKNATTNEEATDMMYAKTSANYDFSLVSDHARVYKGGSWKDIPYWSSPGARRYLDEDEATDYIGFRCAMSRVGSQTQGKGGKR